MTSTIAIRTLLDRWKNDYGQTDNQLATYLDISTEQLGALAAESIPAEPARAGFMAPGQTEHSSGGLVPVVSALSAVADHYGIDHARLLDIVLNRHDGKAPQA